jgi:hypothetical protein
MEQLPSKSKPEFAAILRPHPDQCLQGFCEFCIFLNHPESAGKTQVVSNASIKIFPPRPNSKSSIFPMNSRFFNLLRRQCAFPIFLVSRSIKKLIFGHEAGALSRGQKSLPPLRVPELPVPP